MSHPEYPDSEIFQPIVNTRNSMLKARRHNEGDASGRELHLKVLASQSRSSVKSFHETVRNQNNDQECFYQATVEVKAENETDDRRPSFEEIQAEDCARRPSVTAYQMEDSDHPDIRSIQNLVADMTFGLWNKSISDDQKKMYYIKVAPQYFFSSECFDRLSY